VTSNTVENEQNVEVVMIEINIYDLIMQIVNFLVFLYILKRLFYQPVINFLDTRESKISQAMKDINYQESEAKHLIKEGQDNLNNARRLALEIINKSKDSARKVHEKMLDEANGHALRLVNQAKDEISSDMEKARKKLSEEVLYLSTILTEQILTKNITKEINDKLTENLIAGI